MKNWFTGLASAVLLVAIWQALVMLTGWPKFILPGPALVAETIWESRTLLIEHALYTMFVKAFHGTRVKPFSRNGKHKCLSSESTGFMNNNALLASSS